MGTVSAPSGCGPRDQAALEDALKALDDDPHDILAAGAAVFDAAWYVKNVVRTLLEVEGGLRGRLQLGGRNVTDEEYVVAMQSFHVACTQQFTDPEAGQIVFEQHEDDEPRPGLDGIPA